MAYVSLARKYRPQTFDEIVGQEHIAATLKNAIAMDMVSHAYLFAGPRGVGKTSTARILAKSLNCEKGPTSNPCGVCASCKEIAGGISMDVLEIDGASNRGIEEIRSLKENIKFASIRGKFRLYIIDEVHMLTQEAFNALLKTLEEPPVHVKFIFATTKPYKVLPTILSRCQRFDFRKIPPKDIIEKLKGLREKELFGISDEAIALIAKAADGSLRDAEVILDQLLSFAKGKLEAEDVIKVLGFLEEDILSEIAGSVLKGDKEKILGILTSLIDSGKDPVFIASSIISHFRNLLFAKILKEKNVDFSLDEILYIIYTLSGAIDLMKKTSLDRIPLEISLIKLTERDRLGSIKEVLSRLLALEKKLADFSVPETKMAEAPKTEAVLPPKLEPKIAIPENEIMAEREKLLLQKVRSSWPNVLNFIRTKKMSLAMYLSEGEPIKIEENFLTLAFKKSNSLHKEAVEENANKKMAEEAIKNIVGEKVFLRVEIIEEKREEPPPEEPDGAEMREFQEETPGRINKIGPIVESALDIFEGRVVDIRENKDKEGITRINKK